MLLSLEMPLHSKISDAILYSSLASFSNTSELVEKPPDLFFFPPGIFNSLNKISPNCLGELILNSLFPRNIREGRF